MIDLHTHTTWSDGIQTVHELLQNSEKQGLRYLSITDHNTVDAYSELENPDVRNLFSGKIIPGIEVIFTWNNISNELLGYGVDIEVIAKNEFFSAEFRKKLELEFILSVRKMYEKLGFNLPSIEELAESVERTGTARSMFLATLNNQENLAIANEKLGCQNLSEFRKWRQKQVISSSGQYHTPFPMSYDMETASKVIRDAGGLVFMAHIMRVGDSAMEMLEYAATNKLIDGVEVYYHDPFIPHTPEQIATLEEFAKKHNLLVSGGSDNHRLERPLSELTTEQVNFVLSPKLKTI